MFMPRIVTLFLLIGILLTQTKTQESISWETCSDTDLQQAGAECGLLSVPLDYSNLSGEKIKIALSRIRHNVTQDKYQGIILMNPGGPGISGLTLIIANTALPKAIAETYDWIGFDPRGVGQSQPALSCISTYQDGPRPDYIARNANEEQYWTRKIQDYVDACANNYPHILPFMRTTYVARDMDRIRVALGQKKLNYIGYSYGTYLGQVYATLFPRRVRRMILDAIVDPRYVWFKTLMLQYFGLNRNINLWFDWLAKNDASYKLGRSRCEVSEKWNSIMEDLRKNWKNSTIGPADWIDSFMRIGYSQSSWPLLGSVFSDWYYEHNLNQLVKFRQLMKKDSSDNLYAVAMSVICRDSSWPKGWHGWVQPQWWSYPQAPIVTWRNARYNSPCQYWPIKSLKHLRVIARKMHKFLLIGATLDGATPIQGGFEARKRFQWSSLVIVENDPTHGTVLDGNKCVDDIAAKYLESGVLPERKLGNQADVICPAPLEPSPNSQKFTEVEMKRILSSTLKFP